MMNMSRFHSKSNTPTICDICGEDRSCKFAVCKGMLANEVEICEFCVDGMHEILE